MSRHPIDRRGFLTGAVALGLTALLPRGLRAQAPGIHVLKDPDCGCCGAWVEILEEAGFSVTTEPVPNALLARHKMDSGIPAEMASCHTGHVAGYVIEGHVPPRDIRRLLADRPEARGLAVPGMPFGSPGMGPEERREAYDVHLIRRDGATEIFSRYPAA